MLTFMRFFSTGNAGMLINRDVQHIANLVRMFGEVA